jgi:hypothetical protein
MFPFSSRASFAVTVPGPRMARGRVVEQLVTALVAAGATDIRSDDVSVRFRGTPLQLQSVSGDAPLEAVRDGEVVITVAPYSSTGFACIQCVVRLRFTLGLRLLVAAATVAATALVAAGLAMLGAAPWLAAVVPATTTVLGAWRYQREPLALIERALAAHDTIRARLRVV